jgi:tagaturonate reductase
MAKRILQFGTSRFLQAHVDFFVHEARLAGQDIGPIIIVKTTAGGARDGRVEALGGAQGFPVRFRGHENGRVVDETVMVKSVVRAIDANRDWQGLNQLFAGGTDIVVSNVGEGGYGISAEDRLHRPAAGAVPKSYPAKLLALLAHRFRNGAAPLLILPCELVSGNGAVLRQLLVGLSDAWNESRDFKTWLAASVMICDTLVDRIVSEPIEPIGAVAEPYGLWAIKRQPGFEPPLLHPCITYTDDLEPFLRLKLHILNLGHTYLAQIWQAEQRGADETVRGMLADMGIKQRLLSLYDDEVIPGFAARGMAEAATRYVATTLERFENPFLNHRVCDIAQNHAIKIERRAGDFIAWARKPNPSLALPRLMALVRSAQAIG